MTKKKGINWAQVEQIIRRAVVGNAHTDEQVILYRALTTDRKRYKELHDRLKKEAVDAMVGR